MKKMTMKRKRKKKKKKQKKKKKSSSSNNNNNKTRNSSEDEIANVNFLYRDIVHVYYKIRWTRAYVFMVHCVFLDGKDNVKFRNSSSSGS